MTSNLPNFPCTRVSWSFRNTTHQHAIGLTSGFYPHKNLESQFGKDKKYSVDFHSIKNDRGEDIAQVFKLIIRRR